MGGSYHENSEQFNSVMRYRYCENLAANSYVKRDLHFFFPFLMKHTTKTVIEECKRITNLGSAPLPPCLAALFKFSN